jgi:hypothetical protein
MTTALKRKAIDPDEAPLKALRQIIHDTDNWARENGLDELCGAMQDAYRLARRCEGSGRACTMAMTVPVVYADEPLFQIIAGVPARNALLAASICLGVAFDLSIDSACEGGRAIPILIQMAKAVVDSVAG